MNSASLPVSADTANSAAVNGAAPADALPLDPALAAAQSGAQAPLAFLQFMQVEAPAAPEAMAQPELAAAVPGEAVPAPEAQEEATEADGQPLLAAMSTPLMPSMMAMPAALPAAMRLMAGAPERQERPLDAAPAPAAAAANAGVAALPLAVAAPASPQPVQAHEAVMARAGAAPQPAQPAVAAPTAPAAAPAAAAPAIDAAGADGQAVSGGSAGGITGFGVAASGAPAAAPREGGSLTLSGPPTAWRQSLQEALGDRLNLQLGKNAEQAVIRLDPPMLGRVEISIRHAGGSLEVNITATHSEVLRQLNTVSDNLRNDLAGRQYTDVSVNVSQAPRAQAAAQPGAGFGADAQGRGRQQGQDQDERAPGAALAEANQSTTAFSLAGRA
ncbi:flagellar hook-length control protein FliK [Massilia alkalitolerans]|uniref:flagellar hook-length control protein FliK n=1 Tax=Massilia alkalitolerans TaxID=286638 RepID=UPI000426B240|nr:flagellar hook-length control protein FliK [Massilia alkalitolerans]